MIVQYVDEDDLISLRYMNRTLRDLATPRFVIEYFTHLKVFLSRRSLQMLNDICCDPVLGPQVSTISFASQRLLKRGLEFVVEAEASCHFLVQLTSDDAMSFIHKYSVAYGEQQSLAESGEAILLLTAALDALHTYRKPIALGLVDSVWTEPEEGALGCYTLGRGLFEDYDSWNFWECFRTGTLKILLAAAYRSTCHVDTLSITFEENPREVPDVEELQEKILWGGLEDPSMGLLELEDDGDDKDGILEHVCSRLRVFELKLRHNFDDCEGATAQSLEAMLELATNLEVLRVDSGGRYPYDFCLGVGTYQDDELEMTIGSLGTSRLCDIHFSHCRIPEDELADVLKRNCATLRSINITHCCHDEGGSWSDLLRTFLGEPGEFDFVSLEQLTVTDLYRKPYDDQHMRFLDTPQFVLAGTRTFTNTADFRIDLQQFISELKENGF